MDNKAKVARLYAEAFSKGKLEVLDELLGAGYVNDDPATPGQRITGKEAMRALITGYRSAFPDLRFEVIEQVAEGDLVYTMWTAQGTHQGALMGIPATGRRGDPVRGSTLTRFADGRMVEQRVVWDVAGLMRQLGALPA